MAEKVAVYSTAVAKIKRQLGDYVGRWGDTLLGYVVHAADCAIREAVEFDTGSQEISLTNGTMYYDLSSYIVAVTSVEFSSDGSNWDYVLWPAAYADLDRICPDWKDMTGTVPEYYTLLGVPGAVGAGSTAAGRIMIWRPIETVSSEKIRVNYISHTPVRTGLPWTTTKASHWVQEMLHVPYALSILYAATDSGRADGYYKRYKGNLPIVRAALANEYAEGLSIISGGVQQ